MSQRYRPIGISEAAMFDMPYSSNTNCAGARAITCTASRAQRVPTSTTLSSPTFVLLLEQRIHQQLPRQSLKMSLQPASPTSGQSEQPRTHRITIKSIDMPDDRKDAVIAMAEEALEKMDMEKDMAESLKRQCDT